MLPTTPAYRIEYPFGNVRITIPASRPSGKLIGWTLMWLATVPILGILLYIYRETFADWTYLLIAAMVVMIVLRLTPAVHILLRQGSEETIEISNQAVRIETRLAGLRRAREYAAADLNGMRLEQPRLRKFPWLRYNLAYFEMPASGPLVLEHKGRGIDCGYGLTHAQGGQVLGALYEHLPKYRR